MSVQLYNPNDPATNWAVAQRSVDQFAPHAQFLPDLTIQLDAGHLLNGVTLTEVAPQTVGPFSTTSSVRVDRVVVDRSTGAASIVSGSNGSFTPGAIPSGKLPIARVNLTSTTAAVTDDIIVDERALVDLTAAAAGSPIMFRATLGGTNQTSVPSFTYTKINFNTTDFNVGSAFNTSNARFQPNLSGYYAMTGAFGTDTGASPGIMAVRILKNGTTPTAALDGTDYASNTNTAIVSDVVFMNGSSDYLELEGHIVAPANLFRGETRLTYFTGFKIG